jgi:phospholipid-binding lipoprotein MlaA
MTDDALFQQLDAAEPVAYPDPLERANRVVLRANEGLDRFAVAPLARVYGALMPDPAERAVRRAFSNLGEPASFANHVLQLRPGPAAGTLARFCLNSTLGVAGLFDVAEHFGLRRRAADLGGTLHRWGASSGPYLVLPLLGPTTARDAIGEALDGVVAPQRYWLSPAQQLVLGTSNGISTRRETGDDLDALRESAIDFYAALRTAYFLSRESELREPDESGAATGASASLRSSAVASASNPSRLSTEVYSARRSASSETVPSR